MYAHSVPGDTKSCYVFWHTYENNRWIPVSKSTSVGYPGVQIMEVKSLMKNKRYTDDSYFTPTHTLPEVPGGFYGLTWTPWA